MHRRTPIIMLAVATVVALLPATSAQAPSAAFELEADVPPMLSPDAPTAIEIMVTVGCMEVLENMGEADVSVALADAPEWLQAEPVQLHFGIEECPGHDAVVKNATLSVDTIDAPGLAPFTLALVAQLGDHAAETEAPGVMVDYLPGHLMTPDGDQTFMVNGTTFEFDLALEITANAKTMIMFEDKVVSGAASLTGLRAHIFDVASGDRSLTNRVVFTAPEGEWAEETVSFYTYSHCLDGPDCGENFARNVTWTFQNVGPAVPATDEAPVDKDADAPAVSWAFLLVAMAVAVTLRRR